MSNAPAPKRSAPASLIETLIAALIDVLTTVSGKRVSLEEDDAVTTLDLATTLELLDGFAREGVWPFEPTQLDDALHEISVAVELLEGNLVTPGGESLVSPEEKTSLNQIVTAAIARKDLHEGEGIDINELAALAGVAEKTVRAATNPKSPNPLVVRKMGHWSVVEASDALAWLSRRPGFKPTRFETVAKAPPELQVDTAASLAEACGHYLAKAGARLDFLAPRLGWSADVHDAFAAIVEGRAAEAFASLSAKQLKAFGESVGMASPTSFAAAAYRVLASEHAEAVIETQLPN